MSNEAKPGRDIRDAFFDEIYKVGARDPRIVVMTNDMDVFSLRRFKKDFPNRFVNIGVAEQNMVNVAAGLASCGKTVVIYGIASFVTFRCFEQIKFNICSMNLPVTIVGIGVGFSFGHDGPTHHGTMDIAAMRSLPEMTIYNPGDLATAQASAEMALTSSTPSYVRIDRGAFPDLYGGADATKGYRVLRPLSETNIVSTGFMTAEALHVADRLQAEGIAVGVVDLFQLKPIPHAFQAEILKSSTEIITLEENALTGGLGTSLAEIIADAKSGASLLRLASKDKQFLEYGNREWFLKQNHLDVDSVVAKIHAWHEGGADISSKKKSQPLGRQIS